MPVTTPTRFESLNNELLLEIMECLDAYNLISTFYGLNRRFNSLLRSCYLHLIFDESKRDINIWHTLTSYIDKSQIRFLSFDKSDESIHKQFLPAIDENLRSLVLQNINKSSMQFIFERLPVVNKLKSLFVKNCWYPVTERDGTIENFVFGQHGHRFVSLTECSLVLMPYGRSFPSVTTTFHYLHRLSLNDSRWTTDTVMFLHKNIPHLRCLRIRPYGNFSQVLQSTKIRLSHIQALEILLTNDTPELPSLLALFPDLQRLRVSYYYTESYPALDGRAWQRLIETHLPYLHRMMLDFCEDDENRFDEQFIRTFQTGEFWTNKQLNVETVTNQGTYQDLTVKKIYSGKPWAFDTK